MNYPTVTLAHDARASRRTAPTRHVVFDSERALHAEVCAFFERLQVPHRSQHPVGAGFADVCLELPDGTPWALLELKNGLDAETLSMADTADFMEQAAKYRIESGLPVFIGPFWHANMGVIDGLLYGRPTPLAALSALGGRLDIGVFFLHAIRGHNSSQVGWYGFQLILRQTRIATFSGDLAPALWPTEPLRMVDLGTAGSRKDRR